MFEETYISSTKQNNIDSINESSTKDNNIDSVDESSTSKNNKCSIGSISKLKRLKKQKPKSLSSIIEECDNCGKNNIVENDGYINCQDCGLIFSKHIDSNIEWRS